MKPENEGIQPGSSMIVASYTGSAPVPLAELAEALGIEVLNDPKLPGNISGKIEPRSEGRFRVTLNAGHDPDRRRFTLAHEIAHFILHRELIGEGLTHNAAYQSALSRAHEKEANRYAADLLMPAALVRERWQSGIRSYVAMALEFQVSTEAARIRMAQLELK